MGWISEQAGLWEGAGWGWAASTHWLISSWLYEIQRSGLRSQGRRKTREGSGRCTIRICRFQPAGRSILTWKPSRERKGHGMTDKCRTRCTKEAAQRKDRGTCPGWRTSREETMLRRSRALLRSGGQQEDKFSGGGGIPGRRTQFNNTWIFDTLCYPSQCLAACYTGGKKIQDLT